MGEIILSMDIPKRCLECPFRYKSEEMPLGNYTYQSLFRCKIEPEVLDEDEGDLVYLNDVMMKSKPNWCPLCEVKHTNDFCEWKLDGVYVHCQHNTGLPITCLEEEKYRYKYCPVCGKKIKVVE